MKGLRPANVLDPSLSSAQLSARIAPVVRKPLSDGIEAAPDGSVLVTDVEHGGIARVDGHGEPRSLVRVEGVTWADGVFVTPGGDVYVTESAIPDLHRPLLRPPALDRLRAAHHLYRFRLPH